MKTLIGLVVLLIIILGVIWFARRDDSFLKNIFKKNGTAEQEITGTPTPSVEPTQVTGSDNNLLSCTPELYAQNCMYADKQPVCSNETVIYKDGTRETNTIEYISACHYCKFFGLDQTQKMGEDTIISSGYQAGACQ